MVGFNLYKCKCLVWNVFSRGFEVTHEMKEGKREFFMSDRVVGELDDAVEAGPGEPFDAMIFRKVICKLAQILYSALFGAESEGEVE